MSVNPELFAIFVGVGIDQVEAFEDSEYDLAVAAGRILFELDDRSTQKARDAARAALQILTRDEDIPF